MIAKLAEHENNSVFHADLVIVGGGPVGLTLARQCAAKGHKVLVLESGIETENQEHSALNAVESRGEPCSAVQQAQRRKFHGQQNEHWSQETQPFGVRCRALGGSTHGWAGKSAPFDEIDFRQRPWVANSGWPIEHGDALSYLSRAMDVLNICPDQPPCRFEAEGLRSQYWQFARGRADRFDVMRFGREFLAQDNSGIEVLLDATVTKLGLTADGNTVKSLSVQSVSGKQARIHAKTCVLASGGIENARLLLASNDVHSNGIGNHHDLVGRYLMDHVGTRIATIPVAHASPYIRKFGFFGVNYAKRSHMFMHGLALTPQMQEQEGLLNAAIYFLPQRSPDDPWDSLRRLVKRNSQHPRHDLMSVAKGTSILAKGVGLKLLTSNMTPERVKEFIVDSAIKLSPNTVAEEFSCANIPHKLTGINVEAICENVPDFSSRITLSHRRDRFGAPVAAVDWRIGSAERHTLSKLAEASARASVHAGLAKPHLERWVEEGSPEDCIMIDMAHTLGTTRMAQNERCGVVDTDSKVFGLHNLYVAGGSVFPTSGHANPTLMILALTIRLADHLNARMAQ